MRKVKILFLAANPTDTSYLRLGEEISSIDEELLKARFRDKFDLDQKHAIKADDLSQHLLQVEPDIVHFSGHGSRTGQIYLEDEEGKSHPVSEQTLGNLFSVVGGNIRCVILNACYSEKQAETISKHVDCVIGMSKAIGDEAAIEFAQGFYRGLGYGRDIETSFKLGCAQIDLQNLDEQNTPRILWKNNNPRKINFDVSLSQPTLTPSPTPEPAATVLSAPELILPFDEHVFKLSSTYQVPDPFNVTLEWGSVIGAEKYLVEIWSVPDSFWAGFSHPDSNRTLKRTLIKRTTVTANSYEFDAHLLILGKGFWRVCSINQFNEVSPWSESRTFSFKMKEP